MKLLFVNQYYWPDSAATAQVLCDLCEHLAAHGHEVHVLCSRGSYDVGSSQTQRTPHYELRRGVHIHRVAATGFAKRNVLGRVTDYATFALSLALRFWCTAWRYEAVVTLTTPPLVGLLATPVRKLSRVRHVCWVMDLHPDCEFALGVMNPRKLSSRILLWLNDLHLRGATACVALGEHMRARLLSKRVQPRRVVAIPVWGHDAPAASAQQIEALRSDLGARQKLLVMYSGNAGLIHTFEEVCAAMRELAHDPRFAFVFIGGGRRLREVQAFAQQHRLANVAFRGYFPREQLGVTLAAADVHLVTLRPGMEGVAVPSKLYGVMAAGRPVLFVGPEACETADDLRTHRCGLSVAVGDTAGLLAALRRLAADHHLRRDLGDAARAAYESTFNPAAQCEAWRRFLETLA